MRLLGIDSEFMYSHAIYKNAFVQMPLRDLCSCLGVDKEI
jgi:hypothetical protein